ncbi:chemotaxis protein CheA [Chryseolinea lacunae]|uniref:Chemotaxis protein CheA n=1 Tax=Chryseolinea lacunae TaxID=2801331 RepID=A0ABS1KNQ6_9BACT|nr:chemotaxis protein CheA [Chryseolinea lacunae]MBL0741100.1 chemotaxis protein CheA [Chryseolinea lacunae]
MKNKEEEYKEIFLAEAMSNFEEINRVLTQLEKTPGDKNTVHALFRITHTLKGNAAGMGFTGIAEMAHVLEDLFGEVRDGRISLDENMFASVFKGVDTLGNLVNAVKDNSEVKYKGIKTKLDVLLKRAKEDSKNTSHTVQESFQSFHAEAEVESDDSNAPETSATPELNNQVSFSDLVQVPVRKLDNLLNLVGELIIEKDRILAAQAGKGLRSNEYARLSRISSDLQYSVMDVRLVQVGFLFNKFHRVVRDAATSEKKNVMLKLEGTETEIDRNVLQVISDSMIHLIRNCVGHGIEEPEERIAAGKPKDGVITLSARSETDAVHIEISDDGRGLNYERIKQKAIAKKLITAEDAEKLTREDLSMLIFEPGFSTMETVTSIAGRGVGMDVVKRMLDSIGGTIRVASSEGQGTVMLLTMPSSMAVKASLLFELEREVYAIPLAYTESVISLYKSDIHMAGGGLVATHLGKNFAVVFLKDIFRSPSDTAAQSANTLQNTFAKIHPEEKLEIVIVSFNNRKVGIVVDKLLQQKEIVEKPLMRPVDKVKFISGVTILGSGNVCLVMNIPHLLNFIFGFSAGNKAARNFTLN